MRPGSFLIPVVLLALVVTIFVMASCNKNNSGKPTLKLVSISSPVQVNDSMRTYFKFTGGNQVSNGSLMWIRTRLNQDPPAYSSGLDTTGFQLPSFSGSSGEIYLSLPWNGYLNTGSPENDTLVFKFFLLSSDSTGTSDTVTSPQIIVLYQ